MEKMEEIEGSIADLRTTFRSRKTTSVAWRKNQLRGLIELVQDNEQKIAKALYQDLGKHPAEVYRDEIGIVKKSANHALSCVEKWMAPKKNRLPLLYFPASAQVLSEPLGVVLIFASWNFPISLALDPLIGAIAAGNTVLLKPSDLAPECAAFLQETIPLYLDCNAIKVINGGADVGEKLLQQKWDKIFFTGSTRVGRIVMTAAAKHLTPVTLELGGKCPAVVDTLSSLSDIKVMAKRIVGGKWAACNGQICIGVDYVLVEKKFASTLIDSLKRTIKKFFGENPKDSNSISRIVNKNHFDRLSKLLKDPRVAASIVHGGSSNEENLFIEPTILLDPPLDSEIMTEEIFGPLLPIITLNNIQESIEFVNSRPKPLVIYAFTKDETFKRQILSETSSGSVVFNDTVVQYAADVLPFGGVGQSGFGRYHGKYSFDNFSHEKPVMQRSFFLEMEPRYPPWNDFKINFFRFAYRFDYFNLLLLLLGLKK
ncbi:aldehyde dehydrogenase family 3 member F1-like [Pistacia vera]|uniref:aldehyde dehydrogenase family 3 member F1-like n=1 Tax=Pistacia vera TaxID=55513 RepID=UPI0012630310|nr:aldehyde dehydrogenase family 3 member F1-like [Pistacia vera]